MALHYRAALKVALSDPISTNAKDYSLVDEYSPDLPLTIAWTWIGFSRWVMDLSAALKGTVLGTLLLTILGAVYKDKIYPWLRTLSLRLGLHLPESAPEPKEQGDEGDSREDEGVGRKAAAGDTNGKKKKRKLVDV